MDCNGHAPDKGCWHLVQSLAVAPLLLDIVAADEQAAELQKEAQHVSLPAALLTVEQEQLQLSSVVQLLQHWVPDPTDKAVLHNLQAVDTSLVGASVVKPRLDKAAQHGHHDPVATVTEESKDPACHARADCHCMVHLGGED